MAYTRTWWENDSGDPIDATNLNNLEQGVYDAHRGYKIKELYEGEWNTNAFTDAEKSKLAGVDTTGLEDRVTNNEDDILDLESDVAGLNGDIVLVEATQDAQTITLDAYGVSIALVEADVAQAEIDIVANQGDIVLAEARLDALEAVALPFTPYWQGSKYQGLTLALDTYSEVNRLTTGTLEAGTYGFIHTAVSHYDTLTRSGYCRISPDGGTTWMEFNQELKDITDRNLMTCSNFIELTVPGIIDIIVQARCEQNGDVFTIDNTTLQLERKL